MPTIKKKTRIYMNNVNSMEALLQEIYLESCQNIKQTNDTINELTLNVRPEVVDDWAKVTKSKTDAIKEKTNSIKIKLEVAKLQAESISNSSAINQTMVDKSGGSVTPSHLAEIKQFIKDRMTKDNPS